MRRNLKLIFAAALGVGSMGLTGCYATYRPAGYGGSGYQTPYDRRESYRHAREREHRREWQSGYDYNGNGVIGR